MSPIGIPFALVCVTSPGVGTSPCLRSVSLPKLLQHLLGILVVGIEFQALCIILDGELLVACFQIGLTEAVESVGRFGKGDYSKLEDGDGIVCLAAAKQLITFVVDPPLNDINAFLSFLDRLESGRWSFFLRDANDLVRKCPVPLVVRDRY